MRQALHTTAFLLTLTCSSVLAAVQKPVDSLGKLVPTKEQQRQQQRLRNGHGPADLNHDNLFFEKQELHDMAKTDQWVSFNDNVEFLPSHRIVHSDWDDAQIRNWAARQLESNSQNSNSNTNSGLNNNIYRLSPFVEGDSEYDEYQQAWRLLGFMIDCDDELSRYDDDLYYQNGDNHRGSGDKGTGEGCNRYVIWAAVSN